MDQNAVQIGAWAVTAFAIAGGLNQVLRLLDRTKEKPIPAETYTTKEQCKTQRDAIAARVDRMEAEMGSLKGQLDTMGRDNEERASRLHKRIDQLERDINQVPSQVIALLKTTGAI